MLMRNILFVVKLSCAISTAKKLHTSLSEHCTQLI
uniref:Uncharacterized protein n=1 Tax=Romanomermis culicivorax TaxID=13658 RepID=A0A915IVA7_ROMCU